MQVWICCGRFLTRFWGTNSFFQRIDSSSTGISKVCVSSETCHSTRTCKESTTIEIWIGWESIVVTPFQLQDRSISGSCSSARKNSIQKSFSCLTKPSILGKWDSIRMVICVPPSSSRGTKSMRYWKEVGICCQAARKNTPMLLRLSTIITGVVGWELSSSSKNDCFPLILHYPNTLIIKPIKIC